MRMIIDIHDAAKLFPKLLTDIEKHGEIIITRTGKPVAKLIPIAMKPKREPRKPGSAKGRIWIAPDFDDPLPEDIFYQDDSVIPERKSHD